MDKQVRQNNLQEMVKRKMFEKIQTLKKQGKSISEVSRELELDRKTVRKYWKMNHDGYYKYESFMKERTKKLDSLFPMIEEVYRKNNYSKLNMSSVYDYLEEQGAKLNCSEKTLRNYIKHLIITGRIRIKANVRMYEKVDELPYGQQMQMDFGQYKFESGFKIYLFVVLLSRSRYKYVSVQDHPFTTKDVIAHILDCFDYIGGIPKELVIDQDAVLVNSENSGDILYTRDFDAFIKEMGLGMYVCRKADPESKGKVENLVGYVKKNFLSIRNYSDLNELSKDLASWLSRRANGKISSATMMIPSEVIVEERKHLRQIRSSIFRQDVYAMDERTVGDDSFISYQSSRYSVPTIYLKQKVKIRANEGTLSIHSLDGKLITEHEISNISKKKVIKREHFRENERKAKDLKEEVLNLHDFESWKQFVAMNIRQFPRYVRDQCILAKKYFSNYNDSDSLQNAINYCMDNKLFSFKNLADTVNYLKQQSKNNTTGEEIKISLLHTKRPEVNVEIRDISIYLNLVAFGEKS